MIQRCHRIVFCTCTAHRFTIHTVHHRFTFLFPNNAFVEGRGDVADTPSRRGRSPTTTRPLCCRRAIGHRPFHRHAHGYWPLAVGVGAGPSLASVVDDTCRLIPSSLRSWASTASPGPRPRVLGLDRESWASTAAHGSQLQSTDSCWTALAGSTATPSKISATKSTGRS